MHPLNQLKNLRKANAEIARVRRAAAAVPDAVSREELEELRAGMAELDEILEAQGLILTKLVDFVELPEDYELEVAEDAPEVDQAPADPAQDPEGRALVEGIIERKGESE